jgi:K+-sensing histidine kinase KdpD
MNGAVRINVADRGPGVPEAFRGDLFHRFVQDSSQSDKGKYGIGLGLWVVKAIVEAHNGSIGVEDHEEGGAQFWFTLPLAEDA